MRLLVAPRYGSVACAAITHTCADIHAYLHFFTLPPVEEVLDYYADRPVHRRPASRVLRE